MTHNFKMIDRLRIEQRDGNGKLVDYRETYKPESIEHRIRRALGLDRCLGNDLILDGGLADVADMIMDRYDYMSVGTGTTSPEHDDIGLESEILVRAAATKALVTTFFTDDTVQFSGTFDPDTNVTIAESGIHYLATAPGDVCFARETFTPMACVADRQFQVTWQIILMR